MPKRRQQPDASRRNFLKGAGFVGAAAAAAVTPPVAVNASKIHCCWPNAWANSWDGIAALQAYFGCTSKPMNAADPRRRKRELKNRY